MTSSLSIDVACSIAGKPFTLRFSTRAVAALGTAWGCNGVDETFTKLSEIQSSGKIDLDQTATLLWAGLQKHHPNQTVETILELLDDNGLGNLQPVIEKLSDAIAASMPSQGAAAKRGPTAKTRRK